MNRLTNETVRMLTSLPPEKKEMVEAIVRRHVQACRKNGFQPENMERVFIEAVEMVEIELRAPKVNDPATELSHNWEPFRRYDQYSSPRAA